MRIKLSQAVLASAKPAGARYLLRDTRTLGLALKVEPSGTRTFLFEYRLRGKPSQRYNIGRYGDPWTLDAARREAGRLRALVDQGTDPLAQRAEQMGGGRTVADLMARFLAEKERLGLRAGTLKLYRNVSRALIVPRFGRMHVTEVTVERLEALHGQLRATPTQANYTVGVLGRALSLAERWCWIPRGSNPTRFVSKYPEPRRGEKKGVMLSPEQIARLFSALEEESSAGTDPLALAAIRVAFWTGWRTHSEILRLEWSNINFETGETRLVETKAADEEFRVLPDEALAILRQLPRMAGSPWVFPGRDPLRPRKSILGIWDRVRRRAGLVDLREIGNFRLHDLRHNAVSWDVSRGVALKLAGAAVGHKNQRSTEVYSHFAPHHLRAATNARSQAMLEAVESLSLVPPPPGLVGSSELPSAPN